MALDPFFEELKKEKKLTLHYYGDLVRFLFLLGAVIMLLTLPVLNNLLPVPTLVSILIILALALFAGFTNPRLKSTGIINAGVAIAGFIVFEYYAIVAYVTFTKFTLFFATNQILAIIFLVASYYTVKTLRGMLLRSKSE